MKNLTEGAHRRVGVGTAILANSLILLPGFYLALEHSQDPVSYYQRVQEDGALEWGTFWGFLAASGVAVWGAVRQWRAGPLPWCFVGLALFCFFVAMEEISWGQRVFAYRPPAYFLEHNFQQELNVHNVASTRLRKLVVKLILGGYGVLLPLLLLAPRLGRVARRLGAVVPSATLAPGFLGALVLYEWYPFRYAGEVVELMMGVGFLLAMLHATFQRGLAPAIVVSVAIVGSLSLASANLSQTRAAHPALVRATRAEVALLRDDLAQIMEEEGDLPGACGLHKRLYSYVRKYDVEGLRGLRFSALYEQGVPEERTKFFLDPWNSPYWLRDTCSRKGTRRTTFVYSFGPNRRRESTEWWIQGDDMGSYISHD